MITEMTNVTPAPFGVTLGQIHSEPITREACIYHSSVENSPFMFSMFIIIPKIIVQILNICFSLFYCLVYFLSNCHLQSTTCL